MKNVLLFLTCLSLLWLSSCKAISHGQLTQGFGSLKINKHLPYAPLCEGVRMGTMPGKLVVVSSIGSLAPLRSLDSRG